MGTRLLTCPVPSFYDSRQLVMTNRTVVLSTSQTAILAPKGESMNSIKRLFRIFDNGVIFKWIVVALFVLSALLCLIYTVLLDYSFLKQLKDASFFLGTGLVILALGTLLACLIQVAILLYRGAYEVSRIRESHYSIMSLFAKALRATSESVMFYFVILAPIACLATWLGGTYIVALLPFPGMQSAGGAFLAGLLVLLTLIALALGQLFMSYFVAEMVEMIPAIAGDVAAIRSAKEGRKGA
jgi:hypothetical protein